MGLPLQKNVFGGRGRKATSTANDDIALMKERENSWQNLAPNLLKVG